MILLVELLMKTRSPSPELVVVPPAMIVPADPETPIVSAPDPLATRIPPAAVTPPVAATVPKRRKPAEPMLSVLSRVSLYFIVLM